ncbi:hypothetical protein HDV06_003421 [Boothiomyces sp. JEL0866]|nr:hypothetical protein HDV06_003373 [Boothiomyces sp. JEL0866]KAJ3325651.1 hypothetical protein HDV06_003421 [Boothiomyces sp. JEL0866]
MTINYDCVFGRKLLYTFNYIGYLSYDYYQIRKIIERTRATKFEVIIFGCLYAGRLATICYNMYFMSGIVASPMTSGPFIGAGPCKTKVTAIMVYQEHIYNIIMELIMISKIVQFAFSLNSKKTTWKKIIRYVFDFEIFSFIYYLCCEVLYMVFYQLLPPAQVSFVNVFYNQVYVFLFLTNATHFSQDRVKKAEKLGLKLEKRKPIEGNGQDSEKSTEIVKRTLIVRGIAIYFLVYISYDCVMGRKLMYAVNYIGFLSYDYYQIKKVIERTRPQYYEIVIFILLFLGRMATLTYNVYFMSGIVVNPLTSGPYAGAGPCNSKVTTTMVYMEHLYNIGMETLIILRVFLFAISLNTKKTSWKKIILYVFDFEMFTFVYYLCFEIAYMIIYKILPSSQVSFVNAVYNQVRLINQGLCISLFGECNTFHARQDQESSKIGFEG